MRSFMDKERFFDKMKKKQPIQDVLNNIQNYTIEDINNLRGSHFPTWIKEQLIRKIKEPEKIATQNRAEEIAIMMNNYHDEQIERSNNS